MEEKEVYYTYRVFIKKMLNPICSYFKIRTNLPQDKLMDKILLGLDGNAITFTDLKGTSRCYDRGIIHKIYIREIRK